jgi:hypothetical protein
MASRTQRIFTHHLRTRPGHPARDEDRMISRVQAPLNAQAPPTFVTSRWKPNAAKEAYAKLLAMCPPSRSCAVHQPAGPKHCGVLRGTASGDFTHKGRC